MWSLSLNNNYLLKKKMEESQANQFLQITVFCIKFNTSAYIHFFIASSSSAGEGTLLFMINLMYCVTTSGEVYYIPFMS